MCTVTWLLGPGRVEVFQNRDERHSRLPAAEPQVRRVADRLVLAPTDGDAGGTWLGVNDRGLVVGLLNGALPVPAPTTDPPRSRGLLVLDLLARATLAEALATLEASPLVAYQGFEIFLLAPDRPPETRAWDGSTLRAPPGGPALPLVSSSLDPERARRERLAVWRRLVTASRGATPETIATFHRSHEPAPGPWSVCMHRDDARTVSASHVVVEPGRALFRYAAGPPCRTPFGAPATLAIGG